MFSESKNEETTELECRVCPGHRTLLFFGAEQRVGKRCLVACPLFRDSGKNCFPIPSLQLHPQALASAATQLALHF